MGQTLPGDSLTILHIYYKGYFPDNHTLFIEYNSHFPPLSTFSRNALLKKLQQLEQDSAFYYSFVHGESDGTKAFLSAIWRKKSAEALGVLGRFPSVKSTA